MDIEKVYNDWFYRIAPFRRLYEPIFNLYKYSLPERIVAKRSINLPFVSSGSITITTIPEYYTFIKKIKDNKIKRVIHNNFLPYIKCIKKSNEHTQYIRDIFNRKSILVPGSFLKEFDNISDFYICFNGLCVHPHYLDTYKKDTGYDFSIKYLFSDLEMIGNFFTDAFKFNNVNITDFCKFKDHYKPIGTFGYISLSNNRNDTDLRLCFKTDNNGNLRIKYQESIKIEHYVAHCLNTEPLDPTKIKIKMLN